MRYNGPDEVTLTVIIMMIISFLIHCIHGLGIMIDIKKCDCALVQCREVQRHVLVLVHCSQAAEVIIKFTLVL